MDYKLIRGGDGVRGASEAAQGRFGQLPNLGPFVRFKSFRSAIIENSDAERWTNAPKATSLVDLSEDRRQENIKLLAFIPWPATPHRGTSRATLTFEDSDLKNVVVDPPQSPNY